MIFKVAWKNIITNPLSSLLSSILFAISIIIILLLSIVGYQLEEKFKASKKRVNMVVGPPSSEMELIMSSIYHISPPVQNIKIKDAAFIIADPAVNVVPLAMGDHWAEDGGAGHGEDIERRRIVGTDTSYLSLYNAKIKDGRVWDKDMEVVIGSEVNSLGLKLGDKFAGVHGMVAGEDAHVHEDQLYTVVGILEPSGTVLDQLILCTVQSVWHVHEGHGHGGDDKRSKMRGVRQEFQPPAPQFIYTELDQSDRDSIRNLIQSKIDNIKRFTALDSFNMVQPMSNSKNVRQDLLRIRSNLKAIIRYSHLLASNYYGDTLGIQADSSFSIRDSLSMAGTFLGNHLNNQISRLEALADADDANMPALMNEARAMEAMTYDFIFAYERVETDSIIQVRREMMRKRRPNYKPHYLLEHLDQELTALLVTFKGAGGLRLVQTIKEDHQNVLGVAMVDVQVDNLYTLVEPGVKYIKLLAYIIMIVSGISVLISLVKSLRERKYEMALMRVMGATQVKIFILILLEGVILAILGFLLGFVVAHLLAELMAGQLESEYHYNFTGFIFLKSELWIFLITIGIGFVSALIPALMIMWTNISKTLSKQ